MDTIEEVYGIWVYNGKDFSEGHWYRDNTGIIFNTLFQQVAAAQLRIIHRFDLKPPQLARICFIDYNGQPIPD